jgi:NDP-sugar pyrophosphorylase family protein
VDSGGGTRTHGVVLAGSFPWSDSPLDRLLPRPLLPVAHQPLISYTLRWLRQGGVDDIVVCLNRASRSVRTVMAESGPDLLGLDFYEDALPRGPAGCARDAALASSADTFVVADGATIPVVALADVLRTHRASGATATVVVQGEPGRDGATRLSQPAGMYVFERGALEMVPEKGFQDIKENLIPQLYRAGKHVAAHVANSGSPRVLSAATYIDVNHWAVARMVDHSLTLEGYARSGDALIHETAQVDARARLLGPVLVGPDCKINPGATAIGPVVLGTGCSVAIDAVVSRTVAWNRCLVNARAVVDGCLLADDAIVVANAHVCGEIRVPARRRADLPSVMGARVRSIASFGLWPRPEAR